MERNVSTADRETSALRAETLRLQARLRSSERERDAATQCARVLSAVQRQIVRIAIAETVPEIVAELLHAACDPLGFTRAIYFDVERDGIHARAQVDGTDVVQPSDAIANLEANSPLLGVLRGDMSQSEGDRSGAQPISDVRGRYLLSPLAHGRPFGILYADDSRGSLVASANVALLHELAAVAAAAIGNRARLTRATELATLDSLTGILNRRALAERLTLEVARCRSDYRPLTYVMIDVDDLKGINDARGHARGDETLRNVATVLQSNLRAGDVVGRFGGDEFVVLLVDVARDLASTLVARLSNGLRENGLSCSLGAASYAEGVDENDLDRLADRALYVAKAAGKNRYAFA